MFEDLGGTENINHRRARRVGFELPVRCKHGLTRSTVMLKDMTTHGACIQGIPRQRIGDTVILFLPQLAPKLAFVVWSQDKTRASNSNCRCTKTSLPISSRISRSAICSGSRRVGPKSMPPPSMGQQCRRRAMPPDGVGHCGK